MVEPVSRPFGCGPAIASVDEPGLIESIPLEILYQIFTWSSAEDVDLGLLLTSKSMAQKLAGHPTVRALQNFLTPKELLLLYSEGEKSQVGASKAAVRLLLAREGDGKVESHRPAITTTWCDDGFVKTTQIAVIRRLLRTYWDPVLLRDRRAISSTSHAGLWRQLNQVATGEIALTAEVRLVSQADAVKGRYPWTRIVIWPSSGQISVRDQLYNQQSTICCPLWEAFLASKQAKAVE